MSNLTPEQQAAAYVPCSVVITAGAGTGKTHMLAQRYLYYLRERNLSPLEIVAVTFTANLHGYLLLPIGGGIL